jgi:Nucleotidyltransferase domain
LASTTSWPEVDAYLGEVVARLRGTASGVWLFGSAALGDFDPARSDLDVQAIADERLPERERLAIAAALSHDALPCPVRGLEFVLYAREDLDRPDGPAFQLNLNTGPGMEQRVDLEPDPAEWFWFVVDVAIGRERGVVLHGPPAREVFPAPPDELVRRALGDALAWFRDHEAPGVVAVAAARATVWATERRWLSKSEAARWASEGAQAALSR